MKVRPSQSPPTYYGGKTGRDNGREEPRMPKEEDIIRRAVEALERRELEQTVKDGLRTIIMRSGENRSSFLLAPSFREHIKSRERQTRTTERRTGALIDIDFGEKNPEWRHGAPAEDWMDGAVEEDSDEGESGDRIPDGTEKLRFVCLVPDEFGRFQGGTAYFGPDGWFHASYDREPDLTFLVSVDDMTGGKRFRIE